MRWLLPAVHLLALGIGLGSVWARGRALRGPLADQGFRRVLEADSWWGIAALLWISTGLLRAFAGFEKGAGYYLGNTLFLAKMGLLALVIGLEIRPMMTLIRWRTASRRGQPIDTSPARGLAAVSYLQAGLVILMLIAATGMARGYGMR